MLISGRTFPLIDLQLPPVKDAAIGDCQREVDFKQ